MKEFVKNIIRSVIAFSVTQYKNTAVIIRQQLAKRRLSQKNKENNLVKLE